MEISQIFNVFQTDFNHSRNSNVLIGVGSDKLKAIDLVQKFVKKHNMEPLTQYDLTQLMDMNQTQLDSDHERDCEFIIEAEDINELLE